MTDRRHTDDALAHAIAPYAPLASSAFRAHLDSLELTDAAALEDLALAFAASNGHDRATREIHARLGSAMRSAILRAGYASSIADDAAQEALIVMLVGNSGAAPGLATYKGRAPLVAWGKTIALRIAARIHAAHAKFETMPTDASSGRASSTLARVDELVGRGIRAELRGPVVGAFDRAAAKLSMFDRELLRAVIVDGRSMEQLATEHGVHRATVARWLGRARQQLDTAMREEIARTLVLNESEVSSVLRTVHTSLVLPIDPLLRP